MSIENFGSYQLLKRLATGGMAQIFLARRTGLEGFEKLLVVKRILPHLAENEEFVQMFLDEARIAARLNHPNIVQIFDLGALDGSFFIAMEYIHGDDVRRVWKTAAKQGRSLPLPQACRIVMDACSGLDYAHKRTDAAGKPLNIVHRDVSPQNILVTFDGSVKVVDFGIAKAADQATVTRSGVLKGKYSYMSPEQAAGKRLDCRSDIFALGVVLYELLTGTRLFKRGTDVQTLNAVAECAVDPPSVLNPRISPELDAIVLKALSKRPEARFQEAVQLQMALEDCLIQQQIPSSSAHLSAFMQEIYAERLERERLEGRVLVEELSPQTEEVKPYRSSAAELRRSPRTPTGPALAPSPDGPAAPTRVGSSSRASGLVPRATDETHLALEDDNSDPIETADPPGKPTTDRALKDPHPRAVTEISVLELPSRGGLAKVLVVVGTLLAVAGVGYSVWAVGDEPVNPPVSAAPATVWITTEPAGATLAVDRRPVAGLTPGALPVLPAGPHELELRREGYLPYQTRLEIPTTGEVRLPLIRLTPQHPGPAAPAQVEVTFLSDPPGAQLFLDEVAQGKTPLTVGLSGGSSARARLELSGYADHRATVVVRTGSTQEESYLLQRRTRPAPILPEPAPPVRTGTSPPPATGTGTVRFAVTPWAEVSCGSYNFGPTPFSDRQMRAGTYECKFVNSELGQTRTERIEVKPNGSQKVTVKFE